MDREYRRRARVILVTSRVSTFLEWQKANQSFEELAAYFAFFDYGSYTMTGAGEPERLIGVGVSHNLLSFLDVKPALGRNFNAEEAKDNAPLAIILTHGLWKGRFNSDPNIIGRKITLNSGPASVVGVLPASFDFSAVFPPGSRVDMLVPFPLTQATDRWGNTLAVMGRLKPGVSDFYNRRKPKSKSSMRVSGRRSAALDLRGETH